MTRKSETTNASARAEGVRVRAATDYAAIDWRQVDRTVRRLQARIVKAQREGRHGKVKSLSRVLTRSFAGRATAVKRVTSNRGKRTPGVDGERWTSRRQQARAIDSLRVERYKAKPLRRVYIPKANGKKRPLGIPTMHDRAMQALFLLALEPIAETTADGVSYGFRRGRSTADAAEQVFRCLAMKSQGRWVLEADIKGCFDHIDHQWLLDHVPMDKRVLRQWLKAGYVEKGVWYNVNGGTPQGGIISPVLANMALDGMEKLLNDRYKLWRCHRGKWQWVTPPDKANERINLVRYADDFIVTGRSRDVLEHEVLPMLRDFLAERGLSLSDEKTHITRIEDGFDFLGFHFRKFGETLLTSPSKSSIKRLREKVRNIVRVCRGAPGHVLVGWLNPVLRGWCNYHRHGTSGRVFGQLSNWLFRVIWRHLCRANPRHSRYRLVSRYFTAHNGRRWVFHDRRPDGRDVYLFSPDMVRITRHVKVRNDLNPLDPAWTTYLRRRQRQAASNRVTSPGASRHLIEA
jgi:RNA-directed DNA polymerase